MLVFISYIKRNQTSKEIRGMFVKQLVSYFERYERELLTYGMYALAKL